MSDGPTKAKRGRPRKKKAETPSDFNEIILKVANSPKLVTTPTGLQEMSFFEMNVIATSNENASVRIGARNFVDLTKRASREEEQRKLREAHPSPFERGYTPL